METSLQTLGISDNADDAATSIQDPTYYSLDEFVVLKVEMIRYRILKSVLTAQSKFFKDLFSPQLSSVLIKDNKEGSSNAFPIVLEQVSCTVFSDLLNLIITGSLNPTVATTWKSEKWIPILYLADRWQMPALKQLALDSLRSQVSPHIKIKLGKDFKDESLIRSGLIDICSREAPITETEATEIGIKLTLECTAIREKLWKKFLEEYSMPQVAYAEIAGRIVFTNEYLGISI
ncbi:hypothetical protein Clacol_009467 [Clathrus columnatus]|uniref:BTB domain-containing protein n=1 Tax=Clathrus columnatus TaxID=1419009 RepID=A0AAV5AQM6_9AGAM|nr:hypothetical protein Clacol_009467 [Clathrus columnatus]